MWGDYCYELRKLQVSTKFQFQLFLSAEHEFSGSESGQDDAEPPSEAESSDLSSEPDLNDEEDDISGEEQALEEGSSSEEDSQPAKAGQQTISNDYW